MTPQPTPTHITLAPKPQTLLETPAGQRITLEDSPAPTIVIQDTHGNTIRLDASGVTIVSASAVTLTAPTLTVNAAQSTFTGVLKTETLIATTVAATTYTPGAGNVW